MDAADRCRQMAADCHRWADCAISDAVRKVFLTMAHDWTSRADGLRHRRRKARDRSRVVIRKGVWRVLIVPTSMCGGLTETLGLLAPAVQRQLAQRTNDACKRAQKSRHNFTRRRS
jgi:hypothetical protein